MMLYENEISLPDEIEIKNSEDEPVYEWVLNYFMTWDLPPQK